MGHARAGEDLASVLCRRVVVDTGVSGSCLLMMSPAGSRALIASEGAAAAALEEAQFVTGEGPCVDAFGSGRLVLVSDLGRRPSWPAFGALAADAGIAAVFAFPLQIGGVMLGVLELHRVSPGPLHEDQLTRCLHYMDVASLLMMHREDATPWGLGIADISGHVIQTEVHQATGMVAVQASVDLGAALALIRSRAFVEGRSVIEVAQDLTSGRRRIGGDASIGIEDNGTPG